MSSEDQIWPPKTPCGCFTGLLSCICCLPAGCFLGWFADCVCNDDDHEPCEYTPCKWACLFGQQAGDALHNKVARNGYS